MIRLLCRSCLRLWNMPSANHRASCPHCGGAFDATLGNPGPAHQERALCLSDPLDSLPPFQRRLRALHPPSTQQDDEESHVPPPRGRSVRRCALPRRPRAGRPRRRPGRRHAVGRHASATPTSPARPAAGPATRTAARRTIDALGSTAYYDNASNTAEQITGCHRSKSAEVVHRRRRQRHEPRLLGREDVDVHDGIGRLQARPRLLRRRRAATRARRMMLQQFAATHNVKMVAVSIGGNDFNFAVDRADVRRRTSCCRRRGGRTTATTTRRVTANFTAANVADADGRRSRTRSSTSARRWRNAGYADAPYTIVVQNYSSPIPNGSRLPLLASRATRARPPAAAASGTPTPTGPTAPRCRRSTTRSRTAPRRPASTNVKILDAAERVQRAPAVREHGRPARGEGPAVVDAAPAPSTRPSGSTRSARSSTVFGPYQHPGVAAPELLGPARAAQLRAPGLQRRRAARRHLHDRGTGLNSRGEPNMILN